MKKPAVTRSLFVLRQLHALKRLRSRFVSDAGLPSAVGAALLACALALTVPRAAAQSTPNVPERMTYQGFLVDGDGDALGDTAPKNYDVIFRIYNHENASAPANLLWAEQQTVTVDKGYFSVLLGEGAQVGSEPQSPLSTLFKGPEASERWVGITVKGIGQGGGNVDILPRLRMLSAPYAFLAQQANKLVQDTGDDLISASGNSVTIGGPVTATSFSGDGANLTALNANNITAGTLASDRLATHLTGTRTFSGPVGIGTTTPGYPLSFANTLANTKLSLYDSGGGNGYGLGIQGGQFRLHVDSPSARFTFLNGAAGTELFSILGNGNLNIGAAGRLFAMSPTDAFTYDGKTMGHYALTWASDSWNAFGPTLWQSGYGGIRWFTGGGSRMTLDQAGRLTLNGGFLARGGAPGGFGVNVNGYAFSGNGGDNDSGMFSLGDGDLRFFVNSVQKANMSADGLGIQGGLWVINMPFGDFRNVQWNDNTGRIGYDNSSRRFKENIRPLEDDFATLLKMEPKTYTRPGAPDRWEIGYIAEEFHEAGLTRLVDYDKEGRPDGINYEKICLYLNENARRQEAELKTLKQRCADQAERLAAQARELDELKTRMAALEKLFQEVAAAAKTAGAAPAHLANRPVPGRGF